MMSDKQRHANGGRSVGGAAHRPHATRHTERRDVRRNGSPRRPDQPDACTPADKAVRACAQAEGAKEEGAASSLPWGATGAGQGCQT